MKNDSQIFLVSGSATSKPVAFFHGFIASSQTLLFCPKQVLLTKMPNKYKEFLTKF